MHSVSSNAVAERFGKLNNLESASMFVSPSKSRTFTFNDSTDYTLLGYSDDFGPFYYHRWDYNQTIQIQTISFSFRLIDNKTVFTLTNNGQYWCSVQVFLSNAI